MLCFSLKCSFRTEWLPLVVENAATDCHRLSAILGNPPDLQRAASTKLLPLSQGWSELHDLLALGLWRFFCPNLGPLWKAILSSGLPTSSAEDIIETVWQTGHFIVKYHFRPFLFRCWSREPSLIELLNN